MNYHQGPDAAAGAFAAFGAQIQGFLLVQSKAEKAVDSTVKSGASPTFKTLCG